MTKNSSVSPRFVTRTISSSLPPSLPPSLPRARATHTSFSRAFLGAQAEIMAEDGDDRGDDGTCPVKVEAGNVGTVTATADLTTLALATPRRLQRI